MDGKCLMPILKWNKAFWKIPEGFIFFPGCHLFIYRLFCFIGVPIPVYFRSRLS
jgi:hypothetical protein